MYPFIKHAAVPVWADFATGKYFPPGLVANEAKSSSIASIAKDFPVILIYLCKSI